jgi:hypothetical protein
MEVPFTTEQFFDVFEKYNSTLFPLQLIILLLGIVGLFLLHSKHSLKNKLIGGYLGLLWLWMGFVYHIRFFTEINEAAYIFGAIFILQGLLILYNAFVKDRLIFAFIPQIKDYIGYFFILFGLIIYPLIGYSIINSFSKTISLGLPCPTTILTFGFLMLTSAKFPKYLLIIPSLWAIIGLSAAMNFGVYQDFMMFISAIIAGVILIKRKKQKLHAPNIV